ITVSMRTKEGAKDYRYFPDPDLTVFIIGREMISGIKNSLPELPAQKLRRFVKEYSLSEYDAGILVNSKKDAEFAEECLKKYPEKDKKNMANWLIGPLLSEANTRNLNLHQLGVNIAELTNLIGFVQRQELSHLNAKSVLTQMLDSGKSAQAIIKEKNLLQVSDTAELEGIITAVIRENEKSANDLKNGKTNALMFLVGQVMKKSSGRANPKIVQELIKRRIDNA
ncbi:Asp-tRNA(Asn)/Glu-tRNA(Gln) amidotransferase GatCAB subunit B, partial [bacterium]